VLAALFIGIEIFFQVIGEKYKLHNDKHNNALKNNDSPGLAPPGRHIAETVSVQPPDVFEWL